MLTSSLGHTENKRQESHPLKVASNYANFCFWLEASSLVFQRYTLSPGSFLSSFWESTVWRHFLRTHFPTHLCFTLKCKENKTSQQNSTAFFQTVDNLFLNFRLFKDSFISPVPGTPTSRISPSYLVPFWPVTHFTKELLILFPLLNCLTGLL